MMDDFDLEMEKVLDGIKKEDCKRVLVQLPDGLKPMAEKIVQEIDDKTDAKVFIWLSDCYGGCDIPKGMEGLGVDLIVQFGHNRFHRTPEGW